MPQSAFQHCIGRGRKDCQAFVEKRNVASRKHAIITNIACLSQGILSTGLPELCMTIFHQERGKTPLYSSEKGAFWRFSFRLYFRPL